VAEVTSDLDGDGVSVTVDGRVLRVRRRGTGRIGVDGHNVSISEDGDWRFVEWQGRTYRLQRAPALTIEQTAGDAGRSGGSGRLTAPMPGRIVKIDVDEGQHVVQNQPLVVLEAMKMEHVVAAPHAGVVAAIRVRTGQQVAAGERLLTLGSSETGEPVE
jgi:biotin carboxyl carrier protein